MRIVVLTFSLLFVQPSYADFLDGHKMYSYCIKRSENFEKLYLTAYIAGVVDSEIARTASVDMVGKFKAFCVPDGVELGRLVDVSCGIPEKHPNMRGVGAKYLITFAIGQVWPCPKAPAKPKP